MSSVLERDAPSVIGVDLDKVNQRVQFPTGAISMCSEGNASLRRMVGEVIDRNSIAKFSDLTTCFRRAVALMLHGWPLATATSPDESHSVLLRGVCFQRTNLSIRGACAIQLHICTANVTHFPSLTYTFSKSFL